MKVVVEFSRRAKNPGADLESFLPETQEDKILKKAGEEMLLKYQNGKLPVKSEASAPCCSWRRMESDAVRYEDSRIAVVTCYNIEKGIYKTLMRLGGREYRSKNLIELGIVVIEESGNAVLGFGEITGVC